MRSRLLGSLVLGSLLPAAPLAARPYGSLPYPTREATGSLIGVAVEVDGAPTPLYGAPDASGRWYLEAREGARYEVRLSNRTSERLGVALLVDGLHSISGERFGPARPDPGNPGRLYILDPRGTTTIRGWRTSLEDVQRFTFVDERASYATRSGKANSRMGWIEVLVYRERRRAVTRPRPWDDWVYRRDHPEAPVPGAGAPMPPSPAEEGQAAREPEEDAAPADSARRERAPSKEGRARPESDAPLVQRPAPTPRSFPGTGWGPRAHDPVDRELR